MTLELGASRQRENKMFVGQADQLGKVAFPRSG
jgi:hypothetical protein